MKYERESVTARKLSRWAESLPDNVDLVDYWYNLFLSETLFQITDHPMNNINAFGETRWREDFETFVDRYIPKQGNGYDGEIRYWYAWYLIQLVYAFQLSPKEIANHYGRSMFEDFPNNWYQYHTFGCKLYLEKFVEKYGWPEGVTEFKDFEGYW